MLKQQFIQGDADLFSQALGEQEIATIMSEARGLAKCTCINTKNMPASFMGHEI